MEYIHIAGTNGKGSTAIYLANILGVSHTCGLYTSPHISSPRERFALNGQMISEAGYSEYMAAGKNGGDEHMFCVWTRMALQWFGDNNPDYVVMETGLGGTKDPTNVIDSQMQIITPISFDHMRELGGSIKEIAGEKCGIIKWGATVISHPQNDDAMDIIRRTCDHMDARLIVLDADKIRVKQSGVDGQTFDFSYPGLNLKGARISAMPPAQASNACVAAIAAYELGIDSEDIAEGLKTAVLPARAQCIGGMLIDSSHNAAALRELGSTVKKYFPKTNIIAVTAVMEDKDVRAIADEISSFADTVICTRADKKRGLDSKEYAKYFDNAQTVEDPSYAITYARELAARKKSLIVVCGSFYLVRYALPHRF